jgi:indolepyruvate ferredoxin oxidoreductase beta subunit
MVPPGEADFVVVFEATQLEAGRWHLRAGGTLITPSSLDGVKLKSSKSLNVALLGVLSASLDIPEAEWLAAIRANLPPKLHDANLRAFHAGRSAAKGPNS